MRFIADECCDFAIVKALREAGHEVLLISEVQPGATDTEVTKIGKPSPTPCEKRQEQNSFMMFGLVLTDLPAKN